ncbi:MULTISPECIES: spore germination protein GerPC [Cohnella]|uniref:spore germination protein GerPC n=1 Tax=Cohnella TaxID=329857 RepID=UPI0009BBE72D|nr:MULTISPECIES: spore germination protein GerPC [Cohnella]MBN2984474.1 hypothetical protein [Cohnella algarum]
MTNFWYGPSPAQWQACVQHIRNLEQRLEELRNQLQAMQNEMQELKKTPPVHVEYHFDQLKVSRLDGTLNIGLSPQGMQAPESFDVSAPGMWTAPANGGDAEDEQIRALQREAATYMDSEAPAMLDELSDRMGVPLDGAHRKLIVKDIKSQLNPRVHYYAKNVRYPANGTDAEKQGWKDSVMQKTKRDIEAAISAYLNGMNGKSESKGDETE